MNAKAVIPTNKFSTLSIGDKLLHKILALPPGNVPFAKSLQIGEYCPIKSR
jgi:hypothetical protein